MALGSALLNARRRFFAPAWAPVLNNIVVIAVFVVVGLELSGEPDLERRPDHLVAGAGPRARLDGSASR